jgi:S-adenosylmethionine hydrolase
VGTDRRILIVAINRQLVVCPDNGLITWAWRLHRGATAHELIWRPRESSSRFHGRDIMAPAAAHLSRGADARELGPELDPDAATMLTDLRAQPSGSGRIAGRVVHIDRFGNLITNIDQAAIRKAETASPGRSLAIRIGGQAVFGLGRTYADGEAGRPLALIGSRGYLEIAIRGGSAQHYLGIRLGDAVDLGTVA